MHLGISLTAGAASAVGLPALAVAGVDEVVPVSAACIETSGFGEDVVVAGKGVPTLAASGFGDELAIPATACGLAASIARAEVPVELIGNAGFAATGEEVLAETEAWLTSFFSSGSASLASSKSSSS